MRLLITVLEYNILLNLMECAVQEVLLLLDSDHCAGCTMVYPLPCRQGGERLTANFLPRCFDV